jgi:CheY-like chemotaxis protein
VPALALTAYGGDDDRVTATRAGFQAFVTKPVIPERLVLEVARVAGRDWSPSTF